MEQYKQPIYPIEPWSVTEASFDIKHNYRNETTFALSNGYIGTRGTFAECYDFLETEGMEGTFINGFYESEDIRYGEWNFGFPKKSQSLINLPDLKAIRLCVDGEWFDMRQGSVKQYCRQLHLDQGTVTRSLLWTSPSGKKIAYSSKQFVSLESKHLMAMEVTVTPLNFHGTISFLSTLQADVCNHTQTMNPLVDYGPFGRHLEPDLLYAKDVQLFYQGHTKNSNLTMACGALHDAKGGAFCIISEEADLSANLCFTTQCQEGSTLCLTKYMAYASELDMDIDQLENFITAHLKSAKEKGYHLLEKEHRSILQDFWAHSDVIIEGEDALQQGIRFNLFHIMQSAGRDGKSGMGAKGLSGEGYEGHYFWDTEMYMLPVFIYTMPKLAKNLLDYRFHTLSQARERAKELGHPNGALYPWRTINGTEASTYFPLGTAQYHINADIAYAFWLYITVTNDWDYLKEKGAEVLCETARIWADVGCFVESKGNRYCICAVTGPDEYNAIVDNNFYTNLMAREHLRNALEALDYLCEHDPAAYHSFVQKIGLLEEETIYWKRIVEAMYLPFDETRQVYPLDDGFMMRKPWDDSKIPPEKRHLLYENYHPLFIYRQRMSKQADAILGMYLHSNYFTKEELKRNYDFYQEVTLHHSSLSTCVFGILASQIGYYEESYTYFAQSARMDLDDFHNNFYAGIHAANMAGTWQAIVNGFAGLRTNSGQLSLSPYCPIQWKGYCFHISYQESLLEIHVKPETITITLCNDVIVTGVINDHKFKLNQKGDQIHESI